MSETQVHHGTFTLVRDLDATPARVFNAFARDDLKRRWFGAHSPDYTMVERSFDFRPGGREHAVGQYKGGVRTEFQCQYYDIVEDARIVYVYEMIIDGWKMSVSMATIQVSAHGGLTRLTVTEQGVFFGENGARHAAGREEGTTLLLSILERTLGD